jgi:anti-sigma B factor antagonist
VCTASVRRVGDVTVVDLDGRFTIANAPGVIGRAVAGELESGTRKILLNLARVTYLDSAAGLGELVSSYNRAVREGACLKLVHPDNNTARVLHLTRLDDVFELFEDEVAAINSFRA